MLIHAHDAAHSEEEWRRFLAEQDFGQLVVRGGPDRASPVIVPTHFVVRGNDVLCHLARPNPVWEALEERPRATLSVVGAYTYIPTAWNAGEEAPPEWGVPTSYYASVQVEGDVTLVDDPAEMAELLTALLGHFEPDGGHAPVRAGDNPYGRQFKGIRGIRLEMASVRAKFKFGGNRPLAHRLRVAERLLARGQPLDLAAREHLLRRSGTLRGSASRPE